MRRVGLAVRVTDQRGAAAGASVLELELPERSTLRDLIRTRVREEVARYNLEPTPHFGGLVRPVDAEETLNGYRLARPPAGLGEAGRCRGGGIRPQRVLRDRGRPAVEDLDEELELDAETDVRFVRLTPLVSG